MASDKRIYSSLMIAWAHRYNEQVGQDLVDVPRSQRTMTLHFRLRQFFLGLSHNYDMVAKITKKNPVTALALAQDGSLLAIGCMYMHETLYKISNNVY
jgi:hypothetical protein